MAEGGGLLNRYRALKPYRGFESPLLRATECPMINVQCPMITDHWTLDIGHWTLDLRFPPLLEHQPHECVDGVVVRRAASRNRNVVVARAAVELLIRDIL